MSTVTPAQAIATALAEAGVEYLFGMPGGGNNLDVIGACEAAGIRFVLAHTETAAAIMATAWGEVTGVVGACLVTRGPGAASAVNGAAQAEQDRQPLLVICDTVDQASAPRIAHQNIDQRAMFAPVTSWSTTLGRTDPEQVMHDAIAVATRAPRGAVHLDVDPGSTRRDPPPPPPANQGSPDDLVPHLAAAHRPLIIAGVGARRHTKAVRDLVAGTEIPVMATYKAKGIVPDSGPNTAGTFTNTRTDALLLDQADLILTIGLDSIELLPNPWDRQTPVLSMAESRDRFHYIDPTVTVVGPLAELIPALPTLTDEWAQGTATRHRASIERSLLEAPVLGPGVPPAPVVREVRAAAALGSIATVDAGAHMLVVMLLWTSQLPGDLLISSGLATMGYSLPAAVGVALARPDVRVYCFIGDGGLQMCSGELETLARLGCHVTVIVFNDRTLSLIKAKQRDRGHGGANAVEFTRTDFALLAQAMGVPARHVETEAALREALAEPVTGPLLVDVRVPADAYRQVIDVTRNGGIR
jgi:acetolactate synthase I/II/III large subunit